MIDINEQLHLSKQYHNKNKMIYDYINNVMGKVPIYFASHMRTTGQSVAVNPKLFHVFIQDRGT